MTEITFLALLAGSVIGRALAPLVWLVANKVSEVRGRAAVARFKREHGGRGPFEFWVELLDPRISQLWRDSGCTGPG